VCKDWKGIALNLPAPHKEVLDLSKTNRALDLFQPRKPFYEWVEITVWGNATGLARLKQVGFPFVNSVCARQPGNMRSTYYPGEAGGDSSSTCTSVFLYNKTTFPPLASCRNSLSPGAASSA
jgi:hypothetical protein